MQCISALSQWWITLKTSVLINSVHDGTLLSKNKVIRWHTWKTCRHCAVQEDFLSSFFYTCAHSRWSISLWVTCTVFKWFRHNLSLRITFQKLLQGCAIIQMFMAPQYEQYDECPEDFSLFKMKEYSRSSACQSWKCVRHFIFHYTCFLIQIPLLFS